MSEPEFGGAIEGSPMERDPRSAQDALRAVGERRAS
jgi:hypothetical protein